MPAGRRHAGTVAAARPRSRARRQPGPVPEAYWSLPAAVLLGKLSSSAEGISSGEARRRLAAHGPNRIEAGKRAGALRLLARQFESPLVLVLIFGAVLSFLLRQWTDAAIILVIVAASALLGFSQEYKASAALSALQRRLALTARVRRDGKTAALPADMLVPGDVIALSAGNLVPADGIVLSATDFLVTEAVLTGESMPVEKRPGTCEAMAPVALRSNCAFAGTSVRSGVAQVVVVATGSATAVGDVARSIEAAEPETEFERGVRQFGYLLIRVMVLMVIFVLAVSQARQQPLIESLLFAVALAVGMTPELLPAIVTVTLASGARRMARNGVIVRRLEALENLGSIDLLCTDKTGTLTEGTVTLAAAVDVSGNDSPAVRQHAYLNAAFETGIENPLDAAIKAAGTGFGLGTGPWRKCDEIPYDFVRKRLTIVAEEAGPPSLRRMITKGSFRQVVEICSLVRSGSGVAALDDDAREQCEAFVAARGDEGFRVLAVATREVPVQDDYDITDETGLTLEGFLLFADPPRPEAAQTVASLRALGIGLKIITGDNRNVAVHVATSLGIDCGSILTGADIAQMKDEALQVRAAGAGLFAEIDPQQKERIILALQKSGHAVGYMGDGINDAPALRAADVGITVDQAVDVARQSADIVLLKRDLDVLRIGIESGRRTFANTLKYISITTSANFGNMVSMALATPFLPYLPLLAKQILLNNFLSDIPSLFISSDNVDAEQARSAERWNVAEVRRFMIVFGLVSTVFDLLTFALLLGVFKAGEGEFQTAWFTVSLLTEIVIVLVLRTRGPALRSRPSRALAVSTAAVAAAALAIPYLGPAAAPFGFVALPLPWMGALLLVVMSYLLATELAKRWFYRPERGA